MTIKEMLNNPELVNSIAEDIDDMPPDAEVQYAVWALGYNENREISDAEFLLGEFPDPDSAVACAKALTFEALNNEFEVPEYVAFFSVEVETVVEVLEDEYAGYENIGTIYRREIEVENHVSIPIVAILADEYTLVEDGMLKIACGYLAGFNKNDLVRFQFIDVPESSLLTYKIVSKVVYADGDYWHCELTF